MRFSYLMTLLLLFVPAAGQAELARVGDESDFRAIVDGKTLTRPLIRLQVSSDGTITGSGATREVAGVWVWKDGYFCRDLSWGERDLGYNCQEVRARNDRIRFTSDRGQGDFADFRLRPD